MAFRSITSGTTPDDLWLPDPVTVSLWDHLRPGVDVLVVKRDIAGVETARYPAQVSSEPPQGSWRALIATWTMKDVTQGDLTFKTGDTLVEHFSPFHPYNTFGVFAPNGVFRGWYANVTWPTFLEHDDGALVLTWQDLYLDVVIVLGDEGGEMANLDDDEAAASETLAAVPAVANELVRIRDEIRTLAARHESPFTLPGGRPES